MEIEGIHNESILQINHKQFIFYIFTELLNFKVHSLARAILNYKYVNFWQDSNLCLRTSRALHYLLDHRGYVW